LSDAQRALAAAAVALVAVFALAAVGAATAPRSSHERLVAEFRTLRLGALLLTLAAGIYVGLAVAREQAAGSALEIALAVGFFVLAAAALMRDPRQGLGLLAAGFIGHALVDISHRPGWLDPGLAPRWYFVACAIVDAVLGALCYLPILRK
jgi:hypothetical protein